MVRRPEDIGLLPDGRAPAEDGTSVSPGWGVAAEPLFTRAEAMRTPAFWLLTLFTLLIYPVQAGISLHQAPHLIESGLTATVAETGVTVFSLRSEERR